MNIPPKYEDVVAQLETERARITDYISQRAQTELLLEAALGREAALEISLGHEVVAVGHLQGELVIWKTNACEAAEREAALREELDTVRDLHAKQCCVFCNDTGNLRSVHADLQQRLTVAEQRADELEWLLFGDILEAMDDFGDRHDLKRCREIAKDIRALKPAEDYNELDDDEDLEVFDDQ